MINIKDITQDLKEVELLARIEKITVGISSNGSSYLTINLADPTGRIEARLWNSAKEDEEKIKQNGFFAFKASVSVYKNSLQLKVNKYQEVDVSKLKAFNLKEDDFFLKADIDIDNEYDFIINTIKKLNNKVYSSICLNILESNKEKFKSYPAAISIHHNVVGGLIWHSVSLLRNAIALQGVYKYVEVDWDLVFAGVVLHDIGKVIEMNDKQASDYTLSGKLLGHISIGNTFIKTSAEQLKLLTIDNQLNDDVIKLQHVVLASHGKNEYGSPVEPQLIEGIIISTLDDLDARMYKVNDELKKVEHGTFTGRIFSEDNRMYLRHYKSKK